MWVEFNVNPMGRRVGDCVIRALARVMDQDWETTYTHLCLQGFMMHDMPSANSVWGAYLRAKGFRRGTIADECPDCYTVRDFCSEYARGRYVLALQSHVIAIVNGDYYDTWDSGDEAPLYYWYKEEDE